MLKLIHVGSVYLSIALFFIRGIWMMQGSALLQQKWVRILPHVIDTVLLASAIALAIRIHQYPGTDAWLTAKVVGLILYIVLGTIALRRGRTMRVRVAAWVASLATVGYIVAVAVTRNPVPFLAL